MEQSYLKNLGYGHLAMQPAAKKEYINQMDEHTLRKTIEELRTLLHKTMINNSFTNQAVIEISQELDEYIVRFQKLSLHAKNGEPRF